MKRQCLYLCLLAATSVVASGCHSWGGYNLPPAERMMGPGPMVAGPGPGVLPPGGPAGLPINDVEASLGETQVLFARPEGMQVRWDTGGAFESTPLIVPGRYNFQQGGIYRLKLTNIPNREGVELYPTLEIGPATPRTEAFLAHNALPVQFTPEDFDQVLSGNFVTKVIYLPDPNFQELALAGVETLVSTRLEPGVDPIVEADRRGSILGIIRLGNKDVEMPGADGGMMSGGIINGGEIMGPGVIYQGTQRMPMPISRGTIQPAAHGYAMGGGYGGAPCPSCGPMGGGYGGEMGGQYMGGQYMGDGYGGEMGGQYMGGGPSGLPPAHVAGVTTPSWGMPITGTPIGLPGPAHIPLGAPAGLQKHSIHNHTSIHLPAPTKWLRMDVKQSPGLSYPAQPHRATVHEQNLQVNPRTYQPKGDKFHLVP